MFSFKTRVSYSRVDRNGKVPLHEIMNYFQDCTNFHSEKLGVGVGYMESVGKAWVLAAYKIVINRPITLGQDISVGTMTTSFRGMFASRQFFIRDFEENDMVQADSLWILIDLKNRKPIRITDKDAQMYGVEPGFGGITASRKLKLSEDKHKMPEFVVKKTYIDNNGHMNNADYLRAAEEFLPDQFSCHEMDIVYSKEALEGQTLVPYLHEEENEIGITFENRDGDILTKIRIK